MDDMVGRSVNREPDTRRPRRARQSIPIRLLWSLRGVLQMGGDEQLIQGMGKGFECAKLRASPHFRRRQITGKPDVELLR